MEAAATALDRWHRGGRRGPRPPGQLRTHDPERMPRVTRFWATPLYRRGLRPGRPFGARPVARAVVNSGVCQRRDLPAFGATSREPAQPSLTVALEVCESPAVRAASAISLGSTCPERPVFGVSTQMTPLSASGPIGVDERVDQIAVALAPPQQHQIDDVVGVFVEQLVAAPLLDGIPYGLVDVLVPAELLDDLPRLHAELARDVGRSPAISRGDHAARTPLPVEPCSDAESEHGTRPGATSRYEMSPSRGTIGDANSDTSTSHRRENS